MSGIAESIYMASLRILGGRAPKAMYHVLMVGVGATLEKFPAL